MPDGDAFIAYVGLADHPRAAELIEVVNEAISEAAFTRLAELAQDDPLIRAMTNPDYRLWEAHRVPLEHLRPGMPTLPPAGDRVYVRPDHRSYSRRVERLHWTVSEVTEHWVRLSGRDEDSGIIVASLSVAPDDWETQGPLVLLPIPLDATVLAAMPYAGEG